MNNQPGNHQDASATLTQVVLAAALLVMLLIGAPASAATVVEEIPYDDDADSVVSVEPIEPLSAEELGELVGPIALYPDDLIAIVLPAATYPLQIVQAARFLEARKSDASLKPSEDWDDSVVALLNYPEVLELMNTDLDWTWKLGEAVLIQQEEVIAAVGDFRERARVAGNLKSDERQIVEVVDDGAIEIRPADPEVIYVPYYEPSRVTVYHDYPVYHYYPRRYPVYYYPYPAGYAFSSGYFWGVTSAFSIGWSTRHLHQHYYGYAGHPYFGRRYYDYHYYRRPYLSLGRNHYYGYVERYRHAAHRHHAGNYWRPRHQRYGASPRHRDRYHRHVESRPDRHVDRGNARRMERRSGGRDDFERHRGLREQRDGRRDGRADGDRHGSRRQQLTADRDSDARRQHIQRRAQLGDVKRAQRGPARVDSPRKPDARSRVIARGTTNAAVQTRAGTSRRDGRNAEAMKRGRDLAKLQMQGRTAAVRPAKPRAQPSAQKLRRAEAVAPKPARRAKQRSEPRQVAAAPKVQRGSKVRSKGSNRSSSANRSSRSRGFRKER